MYTFPCKGLGLARSISRRCSKRPCQLHPRRSFHCRSRLPCDSIGRRARWWCWWLSNYRCWDYISRRCSKVECHRLRPRRSFHCRSTLPCDSSGSGRVGGAGGCPTVGAGIISPAGVEMVMTVDPPQTIISLPVQTAVCIARAAGALVVLVAVQLSVLGLYLPPVFKRPCSQLRPRRSFHCRSILLCERLGQRARWWCWWLSNYPCWDCISRRCSKAVDASSAPDDHFAAGPHCRVISSGIGRVGGAGGCPTIRAGIVSSAGVQSVPDRSYPPQTIISLPVHTAV